MTQVKKNLGLLGALVVVTAGIGLYAYFGVFQADQKAEQAKKVSEEIFPAAHDAKDLSAFTQLTITADGQTTTVEKDGTHWKVTSPLQASADNGVIENLLNALKSDSYNQVIEAKPTADDLKKYGLDKPSFHLVATWAPKGEKAQTFELEGGIVNPYDNSVYLLRPGDPAVRSAPGGVRSAALKSTFDLRDKRLLTYDEASLKGVELVRGKEQVSLLKDAANKWQLEKPWKQSGDDDAVKALVVAVQGTRATAFPDASLKPHFGLDAPLMVATFTPKTGAPVTLTIGKGDRKDDVRYYADVAQGATHTIAEVPKTLLDALSKPASDYKDHQVVAFEESAVRKVAFTPTGGGAPLVAERKDGTSQDWTVTAPKKGAAKKWKLSSILWSLHALKATEFGAAHPSAKALAKVGIGPKSEKVTLFGDKDAVLGTIALGDSVKGKKGTIWAKGTQDLLVQIDGTRLSELPQSVEDLLEPPKPAAPGATAKK